ncbi:MAG: NAD(P)/FAD-dependent oxidoreductase [Armatimonadetes bacterium]|nr:NAD(P)/FAD-dependent oxidoreductase [Armatimonadota bacterium]
MTRVDLTIIGGGPVGLFAAFYAGMRGMSVRIIDSLDELGGQLTALYPEKHVFDMPGFPSVLAKDLAAGLARQGTQFGPDLCLGETATGLTRDNEGWTVTGVGGAAYPTRTVLISAGAGAFSPTRLGLVEEPDYEGKGLHYGVKSKSDFEGKDVAIIGGGDSAFDWAVNLHPVARKVTLIHRRDQFKAHEETVKEVEKLGIGFHLWRSVAALHGDGRLSGLTLVDTRSKEEEHFPCDAVVVNIGFKSSLGPIKDWGLTIEKNQIVVDGLYRTGLPGVFAVGDVCTYEGKLKLIATGVGEAVTAVCIAKTLIDPSAKLFPGHSSDMDQFGGH